MAYGELSIESPRSQRVTWKIPNFFQLPREEDSFVESPIFHFAGNHRLQLLTNAQNLVIVLIQDTRRISCNLRFQTGSGEEIDFHRHLPTRNDLRSVAFYVTRRKLEVNRDSYVPGGIFTLICYLALKSSTESPEPQEADTEPSIVNLQSDYKQLLQNGTESDAFLEVSGKELRVHRCVLRARSSVFDAMFGHQTAEKETGRVAIDDLDPDCFVHFLEYLYTGVVGADLLSNHVFGLYKAADKYDVLGLKSECVAHMRRTLSVDSFCDVMTLAELHGEEDLLPLAHTFFKDNIKHIIVTPKWQQFLIDNGKTANELLIKALVPERQLDLDRCYAASIVENRIYSDSS